MMVESLEYDTEVKCDHRLGDDNHDNDNDNDDDNDDDDDDSNDDDDDPIEFHPLPPRQLTESSPNTP